MTTEKMAQGEERQQASLSTEAARNLATTTKTAPQMAGITSRWLLRMLPWVQVSGGVYRVNRRLTYALGDGRVTFTTVGSSMRVIPQELRELPLLRGFEDAEILEALADGFVQREHSAGELIVQAGQPAEHVFLIASGKAIKTRAGKYGDVISLGVLSEGDHFGDGAVVEPEDTWAFTVEAATRCTVLALRQAVLEDLLGSSAALRAHVEAFKAQLRIPKDKDGQAAIELSAGHEGEQELPRTFVDYERRPREYELEVVQSILNMHTRVADLFNDPMNQTEQQLRLTIEALREREEHELVNNREIGLLHNVDPRQRISTRSGPPTPDDMDELLCRRRRTRLFLAHPRAIAAFGRECNRRGVYSEAVLVDGKPAQAWRGVPIFPCDKIPISDARTTSILALRTGEEHQGVVGLRPASLPDEREPGLNVRFMGINDKAIMQYLVSAYYSVAVLVPDALGVLENVELGR